MTTPKKSAKRFTFKITLRDIEPPIWRRITICSDATFKTFHKAIQKAFGWEDAHLYEFTLRDVGGLIKVGLPDTSEPPSKRALSASKVRLDDYLFLTGAKAHYLYDFGDNWGHEVVLESQETLTGSKPRPMCIAGERACPLEDSGGVWGYNNMVKALADPHHPEHAEMRAWAGRGYDPGKFTIPSKMDIWN